jgi:hypothetical protein
MRVAAAAADNISALFCNVMAISNGGIQCCPYSFEHLEGPKPCGSCFLSLGTEIWSLARSSRGTTGVAVGFMQ